MAHKTPEQPEEAGCPLWMVSFGDAMSLLVTFFVMLLAFSTFEEAQLANLLGAMKGGLNALPSITNREQTGRKGRDGISKAGGYEKNIDVDDMSKISPYNHMLQKKNSPSAISENSEDEFFMRMLEEGLSLVIKTDTFFVPGTTEFIPDRARMLGVIADMGVPLDNELRITSVLPSDMEVLDSKVKTVWGLAALRAAAVQQRVAAMAPDKFPMSRFCLGARVEKPGEKSGDAQGLPPERMEITFIGYRDVPKMMGAEGALLKGILE
ncbi:MAG: flagellar motor protein MotB [Kiritimatiellae bacterium]|nr:flagellar motor protein MotB [Kiritimatiellia bacterium]MDD4734796.1 flagellar motor protein MotB [Kiritimatiellia bacterium]